MKKATTFGNVIAIPSIFIVSTAAGVYYNSQVVSLLRDPHYFDVPHDHIGRVQSSILFYSVLFSVILSIGVGYCFDLFGRRRMIALSYLLLCLLIWLLPYMPSIPILTLNRTGV